MTTNEEVKQGVQQLPSEMVCDGDQREKQTRYLAQSKETNASDLTLDNLLINSIVEMSHLLENDGKTMELLGDCGCLQNLWWHNEAKTGQLSHFAKQPHKTVAVMNHKTTIPVSWLKHRGQNYDNVRKTEG
jgi:hypothetical protein